MENSSNTDDFILRVNNLKKYFPVRRGILQRVINHVRAVDGVSFDIKRRETLSLVGESGSGKSTVGRLLARLDDSTEGSIVFNPGVNDVPGYSVGGSDITHSDPSTTKALRRKIQLIFQDPYSSLNPRMKTAEIIGEPLFVNGIARGRVLYDKVREYMSSVGLREDQMFNYPHEFSGGQRQRIGIARALIIEPELIVADEPVSALDSSVQAQVLNLLQDLQKQYGLSFLFISHDLSVVKHISDRIAVMYLGRIVEIAETDELFTNPKHPYTEALISVAPVPNPNIRGKPVILQGDVPSPIDPPGGCAFHPRCRYAAEKCKTETPELQGENGHQVACHFSEELHLQALEGFHT